MENSAGRKQPMVKGASNTDVKSQRKAYEVPEDDDDETCLALRVV